MPGLGPASNCQARQRCCLRDAVSHYAARCSKHSGPCHTLPSGRGFLGYHPDPIQLPSSGNPLTTPCPPHPSMWDPRPGVASIHLARHPSASIPGCKGNIYKSHFQTGYTFVQRSRWVGVAACHLRYLCGKEVGGWHMEGRGGGLEGKTFHVCSNLSRLRVPFPQSLH